MIERFVKYVVSLVLLFVTLFEAHSKEKDIYYCFLTNSSPVPVRDSLIIDAVTKDYFAWKDVGMDDDIYFVQLHTVSGKLEELYYITLSKSLVRELTEDFIYLGSKSNKKARVDYYVGSYLLLEVWNFEKQATEIRYKLKR